MLTAKVCKMVTSLLSSITRENHGSGKFSGRHTLQTINNKNKTSWSRVGNKLMSKFGVERIRRSAAIGN